MKKSELKNYIRENIISTLSEDTDAEIAKTKELTSAIKDLEVAKKEAGIEENDENEDKYYDDYFDIGLFYLEGFNRKHSLTDDELVTLGKKVTDQLYKGDIGNAYDALIDREKPSKFKQAGEASGFDMRGIKEDEDAEPTKSDIKKTKGLAKAKEELALLTREMKSLAKKYSKAEGADKEKLVKTLKAKTKLKKELENILDNKKI